MTKKSGAGKGDKNRTKKHKQYRDNFDNIDWKKKKK